MKNIWNVDGLVFLMPPQEKPGFGHKKFVVRYSDDENGKSLSISDEKSGVMFAIPFEEILNDITKDGGTAT